MTGDPYKEHTSRLVRVGSLTELVARFFTSSLPPILAQEKVGLLPNRHPAYSYPIAGVPCRANQASRNNLPCRWSRLLQSA